MTGPDNIYLWTFLIIAKKILRPISGRTGRARANLMPFLDFGCRGMSFKPTKTTEISENKPNFNEREIKLLSPADDN